LTKKTAKNPVLFLDRDGTINIDLGPQYISDPLQARLIPGAGKAIVRAAGHGFKIAVITNQAGVAKGHTPKEALPGIHKRIEGLIAEEAGVSQFQFDDVRVCTHHPDEKCACRKPGVQLLEESIKELNADPGRSFFVGDKMSDLVCASRGGVRPILVLTGHGFETEAELKMAGRDAVKTAGIVKTLTEAVDLAAKLVTRD
jgi:histidinol-phosphate phosphatase family protein